MNYKGKITLCNKNCYRCKSDFYGKTFYKYQQEVVHYIFPDNIDRKYRATKCTERFKCSRVSDRGFTVHATERVSQQTVPYNTINVYGRFFDLKKWIGKIHLPRASRSSHCCAAVSVMCITRSSLFVLHMCENWYNVVLICACPLHTRKKVD